MCLSRLTQRILIALMILEIVPVAFLMEIKPAEAASWLSGWTYRKKHVLTGVANAGVNYQMMFKVRRGSGTDSGNIVYIGDKCKPDFSDIRFSDLSGNVFSYAITYMSTDEAWFWVKPSIDLSVDQTICVYYGNQDASSLSNLDDTFIFAEDWSSSNLNERWVLEYQGTGIQIDPSMRRVRMGAKGGVYTPAQIKSRNTLLFPSVYRLEAFNAEQYETEISKIAASMTAYLSIDTASTTRVDLSIHHYTYNDPGIAFISFVASASGSNRYNYARAGVGHNDDFSYTIGTNAAGTYTYTGIIQRNASGFIQIYWYNDWKVNEYNTENPERVYLRVYCTYSYENWAYFPAFKIRKYVNPEPGHGEWFAEETYVGAQSYVNVYSYPSWIPNGVFKLDLNTYYIPYSGEITPGTHNLTALDEQVTLNATHIYNFKCWKKNGAVYSYEPSCQFTIDVSETFEFTIVYEAYKVEVSTTPEGLTADFEADGWNLQTPTTIYRGPGYHTFQALTTIVYYNSTHLLKFMGWFVNDLFISPNENINLYIAKNSTVKLAYSLTETPQAPPMTFRAQLVSLGDLAPGSTKEFAITILFDQQAITIEKIEFQTKKEWFEILTPLPTQASRGLETLGTATISAKLTTPQNVQGYYNIPFTVTAKTSQQQTITTTSYATFNISAQPSITETTITTGRFFESIQRLLGNPIILLLLIALIIWLSSYSLKKK